MNAEELALLLWDMAEHIVRADEARITQERLESYRIYPTSRRANNARQEPRN